MDMIIGKSFEELSQNDMYEINGGAGSLIALTAWSSAPCCISASVVTVATLIWG